MKQVVIIGGGAAATNAAQAIKDAKIIMISKEKFLPYFRTRLTKMIDEDISIENLAIKKESWYKDRNIDVILDSEVSKINTKEKEVELSDGRTFKYDDLVIATGANCFVPPFKNVDLENIMVIRNLEDTLKIKELSKNLKKAAIIGGGVLGLETAWGLKNLGLDVSIIEVLPRIMPRQLDEKASKILEEAIINSGIKVYKNVKVQEFFGSSKVEKVIVDNGLEIASDLVIISAGIRPNINFEITGDLKINRGIVVDDYMRTNLESIYACGDVAEYDLKVIGLWTVAMDQGKVAGANISDDTRKYIEKIEPLKFEGMNTKLLSIGTIDDEHDYIIDYENEDKIYKKLVFADDKLIGAILINDLSKQIAIIKGVREKISKEEALKIF